MIMKNTLPVENEAAKEGRKERGCDFSPQGVLQHFSHLKGLWMNARSDEYS